MRPTLEQWQIVKSIVAALCDLPRNERPEYLKSRSGDPVVRSEVISLMAEYERSEFEDFPGTRRFVGRRRLGSGGFGTVYEAYDLEQQVVLALKVLRQEDAASLDRFKREFWTLRELNHPNLVRLYQLFQDDRWFFTMQLVRGAGLIEYLADREDPDRAALRSLLLQLCRGVHALHVSGKLHRDLKPDNVLVTHSGNVVLIDLGMTRDLDSAPVQQSVAIVGSAHYLSPEQGSRGKLSEGTDWYSVGVILFEALTGRYPFEGDTLAEIIERKCAAPAPEPVEFAPDTPADLNDLCRDLLRIDSSARPSGPEILRRLGDAQNHDVRTIAQDRHQYFVGRDGILGRLHELVAALHDSQASLIANLRGKSGIGKTTVLKRFQAELLDRYPKALVLSARCHESARVRFKALDPLIDKLVFHLNSLLPIDVKNLLPREVASLVQLFPAFKRVPAIARIRLNGVVPADSQDLRDLALDALVEMLAKLAETRPVLVCLDDLQWGDNDSAVFFRHILTRAAPPNVALLISYRSEDVGTSPFLRQYHRDLSAANPPSKVQIVSFDLGEFSEREARELTSMLLSSERAGEKTLDLIVKESAGIPFLIVEFARYAAVCAQEERDVQFTPDTIMRHRTGTLPTAARTLLAIVAVAGRPVPEIATYRASKLESEDFPGLQCLVDESLVRVRETPEGQELETYHSRYREAVLSSLDPAVRREAHHALAMALSEQQMPDPAFIAEQFLQAGDERLAAQYFLSAADKASVAFAFDQASDFYRLAATLGSWTLAESGRIARLRGEALIRAGRGTDAARVFISAAVDSPPLEQLDFQRRAAEQFLRCGYLNDGLELVRTVATTLGIRLGEKTWQTSLSLLLRSVAIRVLRSRFRVRSAAAITAHQLAVLDTYWSLAVGLSLVDMIRAFDFSSRHFLKAAWVGEPKRIAMSLALGAGHIMIQRNRRRHADAALTRARLLAEAHGEKQVLAIVEGMGAVCGYLAGEWQSAYRCGVQGEKMLREDGAGVRWEIVSTCIFSLKCLNMMGEWTTYAERIDPLIQEAAHKGDRYATTGLRLLTQAYMLDLIRDDPEGARRTIRSALSEWSQDGFHLQDFYASYGETEIDLYEGRAFEALDRLNRFWLPLKRSLLMRGQVIRILALHLRARALLAAAFRARERDASTARQLAQQAAAASRSIRRERTAWGRPLHQLLDAQCALFSSELGRCESLLRDAEEGFSAAAMNQYRAVAQWCRGNLSPGPEGRRLLDSGGTWMTAAGAIDSRRMFRLFAPGQWETSQ